MDRESRSSGLSFLCLKDVFPHIWMPIEADNFVSTFTWRVARFAARPGEASPGP